MALAVITNAIRLRTMYDESEGPTKADYGDDDYNVVERESDVNLKSEKVSGWTNPLSWTDDGSDDDIVLDM